MVKTELLEYQHYQDVVFKCVNEKRDDKMYIYLLDLIVIDFYLLKCLFLNSEYFSLSIKQYQLKI